MVITRSFTVTLAGLFFLAIQSASSRAAQFCNGATNQFVKVDPRGTYLQPSDAVDVAASASRFRLRSRRIRANDYIGLRLNGAFKAGATFDDDIETLTAVFFTRRKFIAPGQYGQQKAIATHARDIPEDFVVFAGTTTIVRAPRGARHMAFGPDDEYFADNTDPNSDYGVCITLPNAAPSNASGQFGSLRHGLGADESETKAPMSRRFLANLGRIRAQRFDARHNSDGEARRRYGRLGLRNVTPVPAPQYRGWYDNCDNVEGQHCWQPRASRFQRSSGGVSIFAPKGTPIVAPINGGTLTFNPAGYDYRTWGNVAVVSIKKDGAEYHFVYAHLDRFAGRAGVPTKMGRAIGYSGCTGAVSNGARCGVPLDVDGGRTDHVYVALIKQVRQGRRIKSTAINPTSYLGWKIKKPR